MFVYWLMAVGEHISKNLDVWTSHNFLCMLPTAVARRRCDMACTVSQDGAEHSKKTTQADFFNKSMYISLQK